jgi:hypothetical protein
MWPTVCTSMLQAHTNMPGLRHSNACDHQKSGTKLQAASVKQQASSSKLLKVQAASFKPQATSIKLQATSCKLFNIFSFVKFRDARSERLYFLFLLYPNRSGVPNELMFSILVHKILGVNAFHSFQNLDSGFKVMR